MNVAVVGGSGFVGSHVADAFTDAGHQVTVIDRAPSPWIRPTQRFLQIDVLEADAIMQGVAGHDVVCNFAAIADIAECQRSPVEAARVNIEGNLHVLEAARHAHASRFIYASTIYVYSESGGFYRTTKQSSELYIEEYQRQFGLDFTILRFGSLYGPRANASNSVRNYLRQALTERRIHAEGAGHEIREYIHVVDAARLVVRTLAPEFRNARVVLTGHQPMRFSDLLTMISEIIGGVEIELAPPGSLDHYEITPYTFRPRKALKLVSDHYTDLGQGLLECLEEIYGSESDSAES